MSVIAIPIKDFFHEYADPPWLERRVTCPEIGGIANTLLTKCQACKRHWGFGRDEGRSWDNILCKTGGGNHE